MTHIQRGRAGRRALTGTLVLLTAGVCLALVACQTIDNDPSLARDGALLGRVSTGPDIGGPFVVIAVDGVSGKVAHSAFLESETRYDLRVPAGKYKLFAFVDRNRDGRLDNNEPASALYALTTSVQARDRVELPALEIRSGHAVASR